MNEDSQRQEYAEKLYTMATYWLSAVLFFVVVSAVRITAPTWWGQLPLLKPMEIDSSVLITLLGTTTVNVLALFVIVLNYLFPKRSDPLLKLMESPEGTGASASKDGSSRGSAATLSEGQ